MSDKPLDQYMKALDNKKNPPKDVKNPPKFKSELTLENLISISTNRIKK